MSNPGLVMPQSLSEWEGEGQGLHLPMGLERKTMTYVVLKDGLLYS